MRIALTLVSLFAISCSTSNKYIFCCESDDCCPEISDTDDVVYADTDGDALPDRRVLDLVLVDDEDGEQQEVLLERIGFEHSEPSKGTGMGRTRNERLERALKDLERAIEVVRSALR